MIVAIVAMWTVVFFISQKSASVLEITRAKAIEEVKNLPEVKQFINNLATAGSNAEFNTEDHGEEWSIQVFEIVSQDGLSHTATFQWYTVNKKTGEIRDLEGKRINQAN